MAKKKTTGGEKHGRQGDRDRDHACSRRKQIGMDHWLKPETCEIEVTKACNLRCIHCYASAGLPSDNELTDEEILNLLEDNASIRHVIITGGEPLLRKGLMELLEAIRVRGISVSINSNGLMLTQQRIDRLIGMGITEVQISLDGLEKTHDIIRGCMGSFKRTVSAVRRCVGSGMSVEVATVLNRLNKDEIGELLALCKQMGVNKFSVDLFIPTGRAVDGRLSLGLAEYASVVRRITEVSKRVPQTRLLPKCGVGHRKIVVTSQGDILPCVAMPALVLGNIRTHSLTEVCRNSEILRRIRSITDIRECSNCAFRMLCCGGCRARALAMSGRIESPDPAHCMLYCNKADVSEGGGNGASHP